MSTAPAGSAVVIRAATAVDVASITRCVCAAYLRHIERVGKQPWPMLQDYASVIRTSQVHVAEREGRIIGVLELLVTDQGFLLVTASPSTRRLRVPASGGACSPSRRMKLSAKDLNRST